MTQLHWNNDESAECGQGSALCGQRNHMPYMLMTFFRCELPFSNEKKMNVVINQCTEFNIYS